MKRMIVVFLMFFSINVFASDSITLHYIDGSTKTYSMTEMKAYLDISKDMQPRVLPAITGTLGAILGGASAAAAGLGAPVVMLAVVIDGVVYYFYGYGITRFFDEIMLSNAYKSRMAAAKAQMALIEEQSRIVIEQGKEALKKF